MWKTDRGIIRKYPKIFLREDQRLIREAKRGGKGQFLNMSRYRISRNSRYIGAA